MNGFPVMNVFCFNLRVGVLIHSPIVNLNLHFVLLIHNIHVMHVINVRFCIYLRNKSRKPECVGSYNMYWRI